MLNLVRFALRGPSQALLIVTSSGLLTVVLPPLGLFNSAFVGILTLTKGAQSALSIAVIASLLSAGFLWLALGLPQISLVLFGLWLAIIACAAVLRATANLALSLSTAAMIAALALLALYAIVPDPAQIWHTVLSKLLLSAPVDDATLELRANIDTIARWFSGVLAVGFFFNIAFAIVLARWWQASLFRPGEFRREFYNLRLGKALAIVAALLLILGWTLKSELILAIWLISMTLYLFQGIAVVHVLVNAKSVSIAWLVAFYGCLLLFSQLALIVAMIGIAEAWLDYRRRLV